MQVINGNHEQDVFEALCCHWHQVISQLRAIGNLGFTKENVTKVDEESKVCLLGLVSMQYYFAHMLLFEIGSWGLR